MVVRSQVFLDALRAPARHCCRALDQRRRLFKLVPAALLDFQPNSPVVPMPPSGPAAVAPLPGFQARFRDWVGPRQAHVTSLAELLPAIAVQHEGQNLVAPLPEVLLMLLLGPPVVGALERLVDDLRRLLPAPTCDSLGPDAAGAAQPISAGTLTPTRGAMPTLSQRSRLQLLQSAGPTQARLWAPTPSMVDEYVALVAASVVGSGIRTPCTDGEGGRGMGDIKTGDGGRGDEGTGGWGDGGTGGWGDGGMGGRGDGGMGMGRTGGRGDGGTGGRGDGGMGGRKDERRGLGSSKPSPPPAPPNASERRALSAEAAFRIGLIRLKDVESLDDEELEATSSRPAAAGLLHGSPHGTGPACLRAAEAGRQILLNDPQTKDGSMCHPARGC